MPLSSAAVHPFCGDSRPAASACRARRGATPRRPSGPARCGLCSDTNGALPLSYLSVVHLPVYVIPGKLQPCAPAYRLTAGRRRATVRIAVEQRGATARSQALASHEAALRGRLPQPPPQRRGDTRIEWVSATPAVRPGGADPHPTQPGRAPAACGGGYSGRCANCRRKEAL